MNDKDIDKIMKELLKVTKTMPMPVVTEIKLTTNKDAYKILISTMLSLRTKDAATRDASIRLFEKAGNPKEMLKLTEDEISKLIYPVGFYRVKAKNILEVSKIIIEDYNGKVPDEIDELLKLKGVGTDHEVEFDSMLVAISASVDCSIFGAGTDIELAHGRPVTDEMQQTSVPGVFAAGDFLLGPATVVEAVASARTAASGILEYLGIGAD